MPPLLDSFPYPFHEPVARDLHMTLCQLYPAAKAALFAAQKAGINVFMINAEQAPYLLWKDILEAAAAAGLTRALVETAVKDFPRNPRREFLDALLNNTTPVTDREPRALDGTPAFRKGSDDVTEPEALLYYDDLTLPVGRLAWLIGVLKRLQSLAPAVCKLEVSIPGARGFGTAFRIGDDLLLTNWHVLFPEGKKPSAITATFGYEDDGKGHGLAGTAIPCDVKSVKAEQPDDWGIVRAEKPLPAKIPIVALKKAAVPVLKTSAFIIQHPGGDRKRVAYARNQITYVDNQVVQYLSDTQTGSSGAPVLDDQGRLIALHHAGGRPQEVAGQAPLRKNEGVRIERVVQGLAKAHIVL